MPRTSHRLPPDADSIVQGRRAIDALPIDAESRSLARLAASELITNALEHAGLRRGDAIELVTRVDDGLLHVSVCDPGPGPGHRLRPGLGLRVVERATDRWGVDRGPELTCWWFEIDLELGAGGDAQSGDRPAHGLAG